MPETGGYVYLIEDIDEYISRFDGITLTNHGTVNAGDYEDIFYIRFYESGREVLSICPVDEILGVTYFSPDVSDGSVFEYVYYDYSISYDEFVSLAGNGYMS